MKIRQNQNNEIFSVEEAEEIIKAAGTEDLFEKLIPMVRILQVAVE